MRAWLYYRLSRDEDEELNSLTNQRSIIAGYAEKNGFTIAGESFDDNVSGMHFDRDGIEKICEAVEQNQIDAVIVKDLSRLGRHRTQTAVFIDYLKKHDVRVISVTENIDTSNENDDLVIGMKQIINDMYAKDISKKIKSVKRDKQRKGQFIGGKPMYGYKMHPTEKNKIVIDEEVAPVVRQIFTMALDGMSCRKIAATLNEEGVPTPATYCGWNMGRKGPYAGLWSSERISEMLQNETYLGNMVQGRTAKISYKSKKCLKQDRENWVVVENTHEPLIDKETFYKVRMLVNSRRHTRSRTYDFLLKGLIFCHECGYPMAVLNRPPVSGEDRLFFVCRTYQRFTNAGVCSCHSIKEQVVTEAVLAKVREVCEAYLDPQKLQPIATDAVEKARKAENHEAEIKVIQSKIDSLTANLDKMYMDRLTGLLAETDFEIDRTSLEKKRKELEAQKESPVSTEGRAKELVQQFLKSAYTSRELLVSLIERVELTEDKQIIIKFRFREPEAIA